MSAPVLFGQAAEKGRSMGSHHRANRGETDEWLTPPEVLEALGPFDLDPCAPVARPWEIAAKHYTWQNSGLRQPWEGFVWLNPPYGPLAWRWLAKLADHGNGIALIFARTETRGFVETVWQRAHALRFLYGRLHFHYPNGKRAQANAGAPSVLVAYGDEASGRICNCSLPGFFVDLRPRSEKRR